MEQKILDAFYKVILPQANSRNMVSIDGFLFDASFGLASQVDTLYDKNIPVIQIHSQERFSKALIQYTEAMISFLEEYPELQKYDYVYFGGDINSIIEAAVLNVWFNATEEDFRNPEEFLERRSRFLTDSISRQEYFEKHTGSVIDGKVPHHFETNVDVWNPSGNETPYVFRSKMYGEDGSILLLPNIGFGLDDDKAYVYVIHHEKVGTELSKSGRKLNRILYQTNQDLYDDYPEGNIKDVSVSSIVALTLFTSFLQSISCNEMIVKGNFPVRNMAKMNNSRVSYDEFVRICNNTINKYYRNFRRLSYHFPELEITSHPYELDNSMHIQVPSSFSINQEDYIHQVYNSVQSYTNFKKK